MQPFTNYRWSLPAFPTMLLSCVAFSGMAVAVKVLAPDIPPLQLVFWRSSFGCLALLPTIVSLPLPAGRKTLKLLLLRSLSGVVAISCFFYALTKIPVSTALTLSYTSPIFVALYASLLLNEKPNRRLLFILTIGFLGVILIVKPILHVALAPALIGLVGGACSALAYISVYTLNRQLPPAWIIFAFYSVASVCTLPMLLLHPVLPGISHFNTAIHSAARQWVLILAMALCGLLGQIFLTLGFRLDKVSRVGAMSYFTIFFGIFWEIILWQERPNILTLLGCLLIALSGWLLSFWDQGLRYQDEEKTFPPPSS